MSLYTICFSPTGGTKAVTDILVKSFGAVTESIDLVSGGTDYSKYVFAENDICIVAVPSFSGRVPVTAAERLQTMRGNGARAILVVVYGNRAIEDTLLELKNIMTGSGFRPAAAVSAVAEHSIMHVYGAGRPDAADERELTAFADKIVQQLGNKEDVPEVSVPGNFPYKEVKGGGMKPLAGKLVQSVDYVRKNVLLEPFQ